jgi:pimeloyl-ACP methyl ester carboxylesterase
MSAVVIDGGLVHYEAFGRGNPPVLFLHGWIGSWRYWMSTMEAISDKHRTYALDLWGFGDSDKSKPRYDIKDYIALIDNFADNMGIRKAPLVGHSLGAAIALEYMALRPDRVDKVMAVSLPMTVDKDTQSKIIGYTEESTGFMKRFKRTKIIHQEVEQEMKKAQADAIKDSLESVAVWLQQDMKNRLDAAVDDAMVLSVYGKNDDIIDVQSSQIPSLNGNSKNIRRIELAESKHFPMLEEAAKFHRLLQDFLDIEDDLSALELKEEWRRRTR